MFNVKHTGPDSSVTNYAAESYEIGREGPTVKIAIFETIYTDRAPIGSWAGAERNTSAGAQEIAVTNRYGKPLETVWFV